MRFQSKIKYMLLLSFFIQILTSCEDEIEINVDPLTEQVVVDAWLNNRPESQSIFLSKTQSYFENVLPEGVSGATVQVTSSAGIVFEFIETDPGNYVWTPEAGETIGDVGTDYTLQITFEGKSYGAITTLNRVPPIDSITYEYDDDDVDRIRTEFFARDLTGEGDTYWIKTFKNGMFLNKPSELNIAFDAGFSQGAAVDGLIFIPPIRRATNRTPDPDTDDNSDVSPWAVGDEARVEIHSISNEAFFFLSTAQIQMTSGNSGIFAEPVINTKGNIISEDEEEEVLGMFNIAAISEMAVEIQ
ncbi:MAG: DUF4249 domain-containing protein [Chitinophagales bacterium]|nr:DUF4249 domain-containing protein [Chitinophagales bacterium]